MGSTLITRALTASTLILSVLCTISAKLSADDRYPKKWHIKSPSPYMDHRSENLPYLRRDLNAVADLERGKHRVGVMKMTTDEGQKFFSNYWLYREEDSSEISRDTSVSSGIEVGNSTNFSMVPAFRSLLASHMQDSQNQEFNSGGLLESRSPAAALATLQKRSFLCPTGTADCSAIGYPNYCCPLTDTCFAVQDTGLGPVGCCRKDQNCKGTIHNCNDPNTACSSSLGGGCCIQNYICGEIGCVIDPMLVVTTVITVTTMISSTSEIATITTTSIPPFIYTSNIEICSKSFGDGSQTVPTCSTSALSTVTGEEPIRPTNLDSSLPQESFIDPTCPGGFYACEAFHVGGCCRTGRDCGTTSCPPRTFTSLVNEGVTVVVPVRIEPSTTSPSGSCATGWASCAVSEGGGCCPNGWQCGLSECFEKNTVATEKIYKENHSIASKKDIGIMTVIISAFILVAAGMNGL